MSLYVPAMQNASYANLIQQSGRDTARSFLDGVRMHNENKHKAKMMENEQERIDIQRQTMENNAKFRDRALDITEKQFAQQTKMFNQAQQSRVNQKKLNVGVLEYKRKLAEHKAKQNEATNKLDDDVWTNFGVGDPDQKQFIYGEPDVGGKDGWEAVQWATPNEIRDARAKRDGTYKEQPKADPSLFQLIDDPSLLPYHNMLAPEDVRGQLLLNEFE